MTTVATNPWLPYRQPATKARMRLFCFHYAGGSASAFRSWQRLLPAEVELCAVQLPGREQRMRERAYTSFDELLPVLLESLSPYLDRPFALFGHSLGAVLAFELARALRRNSAPLPLLLFASGQSAPQIPNDVPVMHSLPDDAFIARLREFKGTPEEVLQHQDLMRLLLPIIRADFALYESYVYREEAPLNCSLTTLSGLQDQMVPPESVRAWKQQTLAQFNFHMFPGDHFFLNQAQTQILTIVVRQLLAALPA